MNYLNEKEHDYLLIELIKDLYEIDGTRRIQNIFEIPTLPGKLVRACTRKPFDVELTFSNLSIVIETKVDSDENGRWNGQWQTELIYKNAQSLRYLMPEKYFVFITYGTSEFYTKHFAPGPGSSHFIHLGLDKMVDFVSSSVAILPLPLQSKYEEWLRHMKIEQEKRKNALSLLDKFEKFRDGYLSIHKDIDFPKNRFTLCMPELAFPLFGQIAALWNNNPEYYRPFGKVAVYPVRRPSPPHDSILNFWELWDKGEPSLNGMVKSHDKLYFEINEDFNLNLKHNVSVLNPALRNTIHQKLNNQKWPNGVTAQPRQYRQSIYVFYEWDFGLLNNLMNLPCVLKQLSQDKSGALKALK